MTQALEALHANHNARMGEVQGVPVALGYGDFAGEVRAMREGLGVLDREAYGVLIVRGPDAPTFLSGLTTNDVQRLAPGHAQPDLLCANKGKILHPVVVVRLQPAQYAVVCEPGELDAVAGHLDAYHIREDVELGRAPLVRLDLLGPRAAEALQAVGADLARPLGAWRDAPLLTLPLPLGTLPRVMALLPASHAGPWAEALLAAVPDARLVGAEAYDEVRIGAGVPRWGVDFDHNFLPAEAALYDHLSFNKGCYVGQEVHARLHHRGHVNRKLAALRIPEATAAGLQPGAELFAEGQPVGRLTSLARLPEDGARPAIALLRYESLNRGVDFAASAQGPAELTAVTLATDLGAQRA